MTDDQILEDESELNTRPRPTEPAPDEADDTAAQTPPAAPEPEYRVSGWAANANELVAFLEEPNLCHVGTVDEQGYAHITPAWFHWDGEAFYIGADAADAKVANIRRVSSASIEIDQRHPPQARVSSPAAWPW